MYYTTSEYGTTLNMGRPPGVPYSEFSLEVLLRRSGEDNVKEVCFTCCDDNASSTDFPLHSPAVDVL